MNNKLKRLDDLIKLANKYAYHYYTLGESLISDTAYDGMVDEIQQLEKETGFIFSNSPTQKVGGEVLPFLNKVTFEKPLLSLDKTKDTETVKKYSQSEGGTGLYKLYKTFQYNINTAYSILYSIENQTFTITILFGVMNIVA